MNDGLYRVCYGTICAGFVIEHGMVIRCASILRRRFTFFLRFAERVETPLSSPEPAKPRQEDDTYG